MKPRSKKYHTLINTSRELFWKYGFKKISVEEICEKSGISKMTFYRHFSNKTELAKAVFDNVTEEGLIRFRNIMRNNNTSGLEKMELMLAMKLEGTNDISREFLEDFYASPELGLSQYVADKSLQVWQQIIKDFEAAQQKGWFRQDFKPEGLLIMLNKLSETLKDPQMLQIYGNPQALVMELSKFFTFGILPRK